MRPIVHGLEARYTGKIQFTYLDVDDPATSSIKQQLGYRVQPQFFLLDGQGKIVKKWFGVVSEEELVGAFEELLQ
jgi:thioredoxin-like negative regulator of GroEL